MKKQSKAQIKEDEHTDRMLKLAVERLNGLGTDRGAALAAEIERGRERRKR